MVILYLKEDMLLRNHFPSIAIEVHALAEYFFLVQDVQLHK